MGRSSSGVVDGRWLFMNIWMHRRFVSMMHDKWIPSCWLIIGKAGENLLSTTLYHFEGNSMMVRMEDCALDDL